MGEREREADLRLRCQDASDLLGWPAPCNRSQPDVHDLADLASETA